MARHNFTDRERTKGRKRQLRLFYPPRGIATCHPGAKHYGSGLCKPCYDKRQRAKHAAKYKASDQRKHYRRTYGLTLHQLDDMIAKQHGVCLICGKPPERARYKKLQVDHCHRTGRIRGLLCYPCNVFVGHLEQKLHLLPKFLGHIAVSDFRVSTDT